MPDSSMLRLWSCLPIVRHSLTYRTEGSSMTNLPLLRRAWLMLLTLVFSLLSVGRAEAVIFFSNEIERPIDWTLMAGSQRVGIAEEIRVRIGTGSWEERHVLSVGTAIHFGFGAVTVPCRLPVFVTGVAGAVFAVFMLAMLPSLRRRWSMSRGL